MEGILLIDKPKGWTSFDVVAKVRSTARHAALVESYKVESKKSAEPLDFQTFKLSTPLPKVKVGHTGTLDPMATGLLVVLVGKNYTRRAGEFKGADKTYEVVMKLGQTSTTGDDEGKKTAVSDRMPSREEIEAALQKFTGDIMQTPPAFSAMKIDGKRAYQLAREGKEVKLEPRPAKIYESTLTNYEYPLVEFTSKVSSGTYVRSLVEDIGEELGVGAYMADLRRTHAGEYQLVQAIPVDGLSVDVVSQNLIDIS